MHPLLSMVQYMLWMEPPLSHMAPSVISLDDKVLMTNTKETNKTQYQSVLSVHEQLTGTSPVAHVQLPRSAR